MSIHDAMEASALKNAGPLALAHVGDAVYELMVRERLVRRGEKPVAQLHRETVRYVAAPAQARALALLEPVFTEEELRVCRRGRNAHAHAAPRGCTQGEYHAATALEAVFGYLWLAGQTARLQELFAMIADREDENAS